MQGSGQKDGSQLLERLISDEESEEVKVDTVDPKWNILDLIKLALCWALTLTTSTLLTKLHICLVGVQHKAVNDLISTCFIVPLDYSTRFL